MARLPDPPNLSWKPDGTPVADDFEDVYFSLSDGLEETRAVFLRACGLPERWRDRRCFTVAELGFGTGLNFLALLDVWKASEKRDDAWLHFVSAEKHPMRVADVRQALARWPDLEPLSAALLANWPVLTRGLQRIDFPDWRASLSLYIGDAEDALREADFSADAWFLDGFAPSRNESMWSDQIYREMGRLSAPGCIVGTYTVAGAVRRGLAEAGFEVAKRPGFGRKRERLEAIWPDRTSVRSADPYLARPDRHDFDRVVVIGAGIAGASLAYSFSRRGFPVTVLDAGDGPASGASGNPLALVMPRLDAADTAQARILIQSYLYALGTYERACPSAFERIKVRQTAQNETELQRFAKLLADPPLPDDWLSGELTDEAGELWHFNAGLIRPADVVASLLTREGVEAFYNEEVSDLSVLWRRFGERTLFVIASGRGATALLPAMKLPLAGRLGQVDWAEGVPRENDAVSSAVASGTYALKSGDKILFGATFEPISDDKMPLVSDQARAQNIQAFEALTPEMSGLVSGLALQSRASVRATTPDRMPLAGVTWNDDEIRTVLQPFSKGGRLTGALPHFADTYILAGLGARGFTFAPLLAELIASQALGEPLPLARPELEHVAPSRLTVRAIRKGG